MYWFPKPFPPKFFFDWIAWNKIMLIRNQYRFIAVRAFGPKGKRNKYKTGYNEYEKIIN
jgi:hypothetical protein